MRAPDGADRPRLVLVEWEDSAHNAPGWRRANEMRPDFPLIRSAGFLVAEDDTAVVVAGHVGWPEEDSVVSRQVAGDMTIPRRCIVRIVDLLENR